MKETKIKPKPASLLTNLSLVPKAGVEPARAQGSLDFESSASASSATSALYEEL